MQVLRSVQNAQQTGIEQNLFADDDLFAIVRSASLEFRAACVSSASRSPFE
jgi:hypothetical protein